MKGLFTEDPAVRRIALSTPWGFLAMGFGSGLFRRAPGTAGTIAAIPLALVLAAQPTLVGLVVILTLFLVGVRLCRLTAAAIGESDPGAIVWDEIVGFGLVAVLAPPGLPWLVAAFFAFRFFDIVKPWPIRWIERRVGGGFGIMIDDGLAAIYSAVLLRLVEWLAA